MPPHSPIVVRVILLFFAAAATIGATPVSSALNAHDLNTLRSIDLRLATIAHRLAIANVALCRDRVPATGIVLHAATQYDSATRVVAREVFGFATPVAVEAVVPGSAAARSGIVENDGVAAIGATKLASGAAAPSSADRDAALDVLERQDAPVRMAVVRDGRTREVMVPAPLGCRARFEVLLGPEMTAHANAKVVQIGVRFFERYRDDETAVIVAHELAHIILRHRMRLEAAGVKGGLFGEVGRSARLGQRAETEADVLGVTLLYNAGYDPASAARFWQEHGGDIDGGMFRSRTHPATTKRVAAMNEAAKALGPRPYVPPLLATRDQPMAN